MADDFSKHSPFSLDGLLKKVWRINLGKNTAIFRAITVLMTIIITKMILVIKHLAVNGLKIMNSWLYSRNLFAGSHGVVLGLNFCCKLYNVL